MPKPAAANQILLEYNPPEYGRIVKAIGFDRLNLGRDATAQEAEDYVASLVQSIVFGSESDKSAKTAIDATTKIDRKP